MKRVKLFLGLILIIGISVSQCFGATAYVNYNNTVGGNLAQALETTGAARILSILGPGVAANNNVANTAVGMTLGQVLNTSALIQLSLTGGLILQSGATYNVCAQNLGANSGLEQAQQIGTFQGSASSNNQLVSLNATAVAASNTASGAYVYFTNNACTASGSYNAVFNVVSPAGIGAGAKLVVPSVVTSASTPLDPSTGANIVNVRSEFNTILTTQDIISIDYLSSPYDGTHVVAAANASNVIAISANKVAANLTTQSIDYRTNRTLGAAGNAGVTVSQIINLVDSDNWANVSRVYVTDTATCTGANNTLASNVPASGANLTLALAGNGAFNGNATANATICIVVNGSNSISRKVITGNYSYAATSGGVAPAGGVPTSYQVWVPNGYQAVNPYMYVAADETTDVFTRFFNESARDASVFAEVWKSDGSDKVTVTLASIPSKTAGTYWARTIGASAGFPVGTAYTARFTVTVPVNMVNGVSYMKRSSGSERQIPLYKEGNVGQYLFE